MKITSRLAASAGAWVALVALAGCGGSPSATPVTSDSPAPEASQSAVAEPEKDRVEVGQPSALPEDVGQPPGVSSVPGGFPVKEIPIVAGDLVGGSRDRTDGRNAFTVLVEVAEADPAEVIRGVTAQLTGVGFTVEPGVQATTLSVATFKSRKYEVGVNVIRAEGTTTVTYVALRR